MDNKTTVIKLTFIVFYWYQSNSPEKMKSRLLLNYYETNHAINIFLCVDIRS